MSVIRPKPPTDPILHRLPGAWPDAAAAERFAAAVARLEPLRGAVPAGADAGGAMLAAYGTRASPAPRRESALFALLAVARRVREAVDRVVVVADRPERSIVDLLLATCCHPFHDQLERPERGGRPRVFTLGEDDDADRVQGVIDLLGDRPGDAIDRRHAVCEVGACRRPGSRACRAALAAHVAALPPLWVRCAAAAGLPPADDATLLLPVGAGADEACFPALLPAAIAGIDVVRILEGMAAMERRFREAPLHANPVLTFVAVARAPSAAGGPPVRRQFLPPSRWPGLVAWAGALAPADASLPALGFGTALTVGESRRRLDASAGGGAAPDAAGFDAIHLPRADEHALGQLLALVRLARRLEAAEAERPAAGER